MTQALTQALVRVTFALLARLPLPLNHALGAFLGWCTWILPTRMRRISLANLERCYPQTPSRWRRQVARRSLMETGKALTEAPWLWRAGPRRIRGLLCQGEGEDHLTAALAQGRGAFFVSPHLGSWEFAGLHATGFGPMTSLYRPPRLQALDAPLRAARQATGAHLVPTDRSGIRRIRQALAQGGIVGLLPDQTPKGGGGVFVPFFGQPTLTMTLLPRLAGPRRIPVVFAFAERLPRGRGYRYHCVPAPQALYDPDPHTAAAAMNRAVETLVRRCPEQYVWSYRRFAARPPQPPA